MCRCQKKRKSVAVWGPDPVGLFACEWSKLAEARCVIAIDQVPARLALAKKMECDIINFDEQSDVVNEIYKLESEGFDCSIDVAAFRCTKGLLHTIQGKMSLEIDGSENLNEALRTTRKFGTISLVAGYAAMTNLFLIGALMEKGITVRGYGQEPVQRYWRELLKKVEGGEFDPTIILSLRFKMDELSE